MWLVAAIFSFTVFILMKLEKSVKNPNSRADTIAGVLIVGAFVVVGLLVNVLDKSDQDPEAVILAVVLLVGLLAFIFWAVCRDSQEEQKERITTAQEIYAARDRRHEAIKLRAHELALKKPYKFDSFEQCMEHFRVCEIAIRVHKDDLRKFFKCVDVYGKETSVPFECYRSPEISAMGPMTKISLTDGYCDALKKFDGTIVADNGLVFSCDAYEDSVMEFESLFRNTEKLIRTNTPIVEFSVIYALYLIEHPVL